MLHCFCHSIKKNAHYLPAFCSWFIFALFFYAFFTLSNQGASLSSFKVASASYSRLPIIKDTLVLGPSKVLYESLFPAQIFYEPYYWRPPLIGKDIALELNRRAPVYEQVDPVWLPLVEALVEDGFDRLSVRKVFASLGSGAYSPAFMATKVQELYGVGAIYHNTLYPAEKPVPTGYQRPVQGTSAADCRLFLQKHADVFTDIKKTYGVPPEIIMGILMVETGLGANLGSDSALRALASMAVTDSAEMLASDGTQRQVKAISAPMLSKTLRAKSAWAYKETRALVQFAIQNNIEASSIPGSMYGAIGLCQFMPSNIEAYGVDGDNDGKIDLFSVVDAMYSVANYLKQNGWSSGLSKNGKIQVITTYNHDLQYANNVVAVAEQVSLAKDGKLDGRNLMSAIRSYGGGRGSVDRYLARRNSRGGGKIHVGGLESYADLLQ